MLFHAKDDSLHAEERLTLLEEEDAEDRLEALLIIEFHHETLHCLVSKFSSSRRCPSFGYNSLMIFCPYDFPSLYLRWGFSLFLKRVSRLGLPHTSWRSKCQYQQPPPLILAKGVEEAEWGDEQRREYVRKRMRRRRLGINVNPLIATVLPNLLLLSLLLWNPFHDNDT
ncbi:hypothetical protein EZV62_026755 [Acer yangbiense]|uniref:Transmembrane protein n=1 Tax=Acer yangbiense TaxID=1000413 RepID=A0A5C7GRS2_9ROSI|nr:hypothetical protein EZV62_026755 [Acer yangbiense]